MGLPGLWDYPRYTEFLLSLRFLHFFFFFLPLSTSPHITSHPPVHLSSHSLQFCHSSLFSLSSVLPLVSFFLFLLLLPLLPFPSNFSGFDMYAIIPSSGEKRREEGTQNHLFTFYRMTKLLLHLLLYQPFFLLSFQRQVQKGNCFDPTRNPF